MQNHTFVLITLCFHSISLDTRWFKTLFLSIGTSLFLVQYLPLWNNVRFFFFFKILPVFTDTDILSADSFGGHRFDLF
jgi:hypothetical protein